jgi:hypothetical protein
MSLESALDEEMREVMALLEGRPVAAARPTRNESPSVAARAQSPAASASPVRSMLDIDGPPMRSMLDIVSSPGPRSSSRGPVPSSPPPTTRGLASPALNPESAYKFEMLPTIEAHSMPKRVSQGGKKNKPRAMSSVYGESDLLPSPRDQTRHGSLGGFLGKQKSSSPGPGRSQSPGGRKLNTNPLNLMPTPNKYVTDTGKVIDMTSAYRRLSDAALLRAGGGLSNLPTRKGSDPTRGEALAPGGGVRLAIDESGDDEAAVESSADDDTDDSDGESWGAKKRRGRRRTRADGTDRTPKSLLAAAEEERQ